MRSLRTDQLSIRLLQWVDAVTRTLAHSVLNGPLSKLEGVVVHTVKVTCKDQVKEKEWMIALFFEDFWDENVATRVAECLVREHGQFVRSGKSDLWSVLGITSKVSSSVNRTDLPKKALAKDDHPLLPLSAALVGYSIYPLPIQGLRPREQKE